VKKARRVLLGNSLTANLLARNDDLVVDVWEGGSDLYGWSLGSLCIERVPMFLPRACCQQLLRDSLTEVNVEVTVEGPEKGLAEKFGEATKTTLWLGGKLLVPERPLCTYFREFLRRVTTTRIFSPISRIDLSYKVLRTYHCDIEYDELVNTLPLDYFLSKAGLNDLRSHLGYRSAHAVLAVAESRLEDYTKIFVGHRGYLVGYVVSYGRSPLGNYIYAFTPITRSTLKAELIGRTLSELKRLKIIEGHIKMLRTHLIKYFMFSGSTEEVSETLRKYGIALAGRYGTWADLSICDICRS